MLSFDFLLFIIRVIKGFGEVDIQEIKATTPDKSPNKQLAKSPIVHKDNPYGVDDSSPFLLLDVRSAESFRLCHIVGGLIKTNCNFD